MDQGSQFFQGSIRSGRSPQQRIHPTSIIRKQSAIKVKEELRTGSIQNIFLPFQFKQFPEETLAQSLNSLIYGSFVTLNFMDKDNQMQFRQGVAYIIPESSQYLQFVDKRSYKRYAINLLDIVELDAHESEVPLQLLESMTEQVCFLTVTTWVPVNSCYRTYYAEFSTPTKRNWFHQAVQHQAIHEKYMMQFLNPINFMRNQLAFIQKATNKKLLQAHDIQLLLHKLKYVYGLESLKHIFFKDKQKDISTQNLIDIFTEVLKKHSLRPMFAQICQLNEIADDFEGCMKPKDFKSFLQIEQKEQIHEEQVTALVSQMLIAGADNQDQTLISFISFSEYLFSNFNIIIQPQESYQSATDMIYPLTDYYINSGYHIFGKDIDPSKSRILENLAHLDQPSLQVAYVLSRGVRNIEIEVWENQDLFPVCAYGPMLSDYVSVNDILEVIKKYAFNSTSLPLLLNIEDHCSKIGKERMAEAINQTLGELLVNNDLFDSIPSPKMLEGKIVLSGSTKIKSIKMAKPQKKLDLEGLDEDSESLQQHLLFFHASNAMLASRRSRNFLIHSNNDIDCKIVANKSPTSSSYSRGSYASVNHERLVETNRLIQSQGLQLQGVQTQYHFCQVPLNSMNKIRDTKMIYEVTDLHHKQIVILRRQARQESATVISEIKEIESLLWHQRQLCNEFLLKQYPTERTKNNRNTSSHAYLIGVQMVVMQHQLIDFDYMYNYAIFGGVDGVLRGFVLKPSSLKGTLVHRQKSASTKRSSEISVQAKTCSTMQLRIISGHFLLNENTSIPLETELFVQVSLFINLEVIVRTPEFAHSEKLQMQVTNKVQSGSQIHQFDSDFQFDLPKVNSYFSVIMFIVYANDSDTLVSWNSFKCENLREGYRVVPLMDEYLNKISHSSLFVKLNII